MSTPPTVAVSEANSIKKALLANPATHLLNGSSNVGSTGFSTPQRIQNEPGYKTPVFTGKEEQRQLVMSLVAHKGFIPRDIVPIEVNWFYSNLGVDDSYFESENAEAIADNILALYGAKLQAFTRHNPESLVIDLEKVKEDSAIFIHNSPPGQTAIEGPGAHCEHKIDEFIDSSTAEKAFRVETYRSAGSISSTASQQLRCYFVTKCEWVKPEVNNNNPPTLGGRSTNIRAVSDKAFLERASENTLEIYQRILNNVESRQGPVLEYFEVEGTQEHRLVLGYKMKGTKHLFSALSELYHFYGLYSSRKYVEQFANGVTIISLYLNPVPDAHTHFPPISHSIVQIMKEASLLYVLPDNPFFGHGISQHDGIGDDYEADRQPSGGHAVQEATYAYAGWVFAQHFCNRLGPSYLALKDLLDESDPLQADVLNAIKKRFRQETFTRQGIREVILAYPELVRLLYVHFAGIHYPPSTPNDEGIGPTLSYMRLQTEAPLSDEELLVRIRKTVSNKDEAQVLESILTFNKHVLRTNFYTPTKVALSFRLSPDFLPESEYPKRPFGMFFVLGSDFRGFHIRMRDVARGGIRIVRSRGRENYSINQRSLFDENYALASTQDLKNKDIPEGGAKGTILPNLTADPVICFEKYVDSIYDLLLPGLTPNIKEPIVDLLGRPELLFFGPDEGTANLMDWASAHARIRGAPWWKSITTGKTASTMGGVPHDVYGMTSRSVREYVIGTYAKLKLKEEEITKVQTGGPDGDLGSNEILLSSDKTIAIIDGSGVLHDPHGLDRGELVRLAKSRKMVVHFDKQKLSPQGYLILVEHRDVKLPSGEVVADGTEFRNTAHLRYKADLFVPCGGRPEAINVSNVSQLWNADGQPHFKFIVEGANLFITQQARLQLEKKGVVLFKDSSANKGGVSCSSLDVLAGLSLTDEEHDQLMTYPGQPTPPKFYQAYVQDIQSRIAKNASLEFACIWNESERLGSSKPRTILSDELSNKINELTTELETSELFDDVPTRRGVISQAVPPTLLKHVGLDTLLKRLPEQYQRALFSSFVASQFIYTHGINATAVNFLFFCKHLAAAKA